VTRPWLEKAIHIGCLAAAIGADVTWLLRPGPLVLKVLHFAFLTIAVVRPLNALLVLAGLGPLAWEIATLLAKDFSGERLLEEAVVAVVTGALVHWRSTDTPSRTAAPALAVAVLAITSGIVQMPARLLIGATAQTTAWDHVVSLWTNGMDLAWHPVAAGLFVVEGAALVWVGERFVRANRTSAARIVGLGLAAFAATACLNIYRVAGAALRTGEFFATAGPLFTTVRYNMFYDRNAAASIFVLIFIAGAALVRRPWSRVVVTCLELAAVLVAIWLCGSRIALFAVVLVTAGTIAAWSAPARRRAWWVTSAVVVALVVAVVAYAALYPGRNDAATSSLAGRLSMSKVALRMARTAPMFGVGVGTFPDHAINFGSEYGAENAHNNALQVLAEEGLMGLGATLALLWVAIVPSARMGGALDRERVGLVGGVAAFLVTMLTGHPLLVPEVALPFWMFMGVLAGLSPPPAEIRRTAILTVIGISLIALASVPVRAAHVRAQADFEHVGIGVSQWRTDPSGVRYREAQASFALFLPSNHVSVMPIRRAPGTPNPLLLEIHLGGRPLKVLTLSGDGWISLDVAVPGTGRLFERIDFQVRSSSGEVLPLRCVDVGRP
jgi:O-antigen ligase